MTVYKALKGVFSLRANLMCLGVLALVYGATVLWLAYTGSPLLLLAIGEPELYRQFLTP